MNNLFSIGELAKYQHVSKQTLIFYDKIGLFRPAFVDPSNGYRYYSAKQIDYLDTILIMKKIGFSLEEIRTHMQDYTIDSSLIALRKQLSVLDSRIQELSLIRSRLASRCEQMEDAKSCLRKEIPAGVEKVNARRILLHPVEAHRVKEIADHRLCRFCSVTVAPKRRAELPIQLTPTIAGTEPIDKDLTDNRTAFFFHNGPVIGFQTGVGVLGGGKQIIHIARCLRFLAEIAVNFRVRSPIADTAFCILQTKRPQNEPCGFKLFCALMFHLGLQTFLLSSGR